VLADKNPLGIERSFSIRVSAKKCAEIAENTVKNTKKGRNFAPFFP
jgi:hypothetical protein